MKIFNINTPISEAKGFEIANTEFFSEMTFLDAELIFWDVKSSYDSLPGSEDIVTKLSPDHYKHYVELFNNRTEELDTFFKLGRSLIITSPIFHDHRFVIENIDEQQTLSFGDCLTIYTPNVEYKAGTNILPIEEEFVQDFFHPNYFLFDYTMVLTDKVGIPLMHIKDTDQIVSSFYRVENGFIIILPYFTFNRNAQDPQQLFIGCTIDLIKGLKKYRQPCGISIPEWTNQYLLNGENDEIEKLNLLTQKQLQINESIELQKSSLTNLINLKALFSTHGDTLEETVEFVLKEIGFEVNRPNISRTDLIISHEERIAVVEVKGVTKSSAEKHAAQLEKWVSLFYEEKGIRPKAILIVNTFRNDKIEDRSSINFPDQMIKYVTNREHCLITGIQLLCLFIDLKFGRINQEEALKLLFNTVGELKYSNSPLDYITPVVKIEKK